MDRVHPASSHSSETFVLRIKQNKTKEKENDSWNNKNKKCMQATEEQKWAFFYRVAFVIY